ncbi:hypothetical protein B0H14DRAFT_2591414 [Mycena olivaceomarginata]|nr:hypothetical protein B0H14DRAFT_2591414 [Mycena olivaceomarginata]
MDTVLHLGYYIHTEEHQEVMLLITRMVVLANRNHHSLPAATEEDEWISRPLVPLIPPLQKNVYDCGVWVLSVILSVLRGYVNPGVSEEQMGQVRQLFSSYVLNLPHKP